jgi:membrane glycosyltransferase
VDGQSAAQPKSPPTLAVTLEALIHDWRGVYQRLRAYLAALGADSSLHHPLALHAVEQTASSDEWIAAREPHGEALRVLRRAVTRGRADERVDRGDRGVDDDRRFFEWRLARAFGRDSPPPSPTPKIARASMEPKRILRRGLRRRIVAASEPDPWNPVKAVSHGRVPRAVRAMRLRLRWVRVAFYRRALLLLLVLIPTVIATEFMLGVLPYQGRTVLEVAISVLFGALFGWISIGFWTAMAGFFLLLFRRDRFAITRTSHGRVEIEPRTRVAIIMPISEEPVDRVFAGLQAMYRSLEKTGWLAAFDFFVLSDTANPDVAVREEAAWLAWCRAVDGFGRIFYRRRRIRVKRKSGNVADFCRRFGRQYRYMLTLDADSLMSGETIVRLASLMDDNPGVGMIQTVPVSIDARSLYARIQQFANRVYGPLFSAGMHYWQLGDAQYWGHNAIVRLAPFMKHCALPRLPGKPPLGGEILSHDFVEAAMLGRAGYSIWMAYELGGSYEELPSSLLEDLARDRRWAQGNFQHIRLVFVEGVFHVHRFLFVNGVLAYVSALLWFLFLSLSTAEAILRAVKEPDYFPSGPTLFPEWPIWRPDWAYSLLTVTMAILFLPKILSAILVMVRGPGVRFYGGFFAFLTSILLEFVASTLFAPIRMVFHSKFVLTNLMGRIVVWRSPPRGDQETTWSEAFRHLGLTTVLACLWGGGVYWLNPGYFWWLTPILAALVLSVPVSVLVSRVKLGGRTRAFRLFNTPEETAPPAELAELRNLVAAASVRERELPPPERDGFVRAVADPLVNALHRWMLRGARTVRPSIREARHKLVERAIADGPQSLTPRERRTLLLDATAVDELHRRVWAIADGHRAGRWGRPGLST